MAKFKINPGYDDEKVVEAHSFAENGTFVVFTKSTQRGAHEQVYAQRTADVYKIERVEE